MFTKQRRTIIINPINNKYGHLEAIADKSATPTSAESSLPETIANNLSMLFFLSFYKVINTVSNNNNKNNKQWPEVTRSN